ncbi:glycosyltransferase family 39 protein [Hymenobacter sp. HD11105]
MTFFDDLIDKLLPTRHQRLITGLFFGLLLLIGLLLHRDYGVSADERVDRLNGMVNVKYIAELVAPSIVQNQADGHLIPPLKNYIENDHGVAFEIPMALISFVFTRGDSQSAYFLRHLCIFLIFVAGTYALFRLSSFSLRSWRWGLLTALLLVLSPRLFADGFYNAKDIVFMALFTAGIYTLLRFLQRPSYRWALLHALVTALAVDIRILGMLLAAFTVGMVGLELLLPTQKRTTNRPLLLGTLLYAVITPVLVLVGWPALWEAPIDNLLYSFRSLSKYPFRGSLLYWGNIIQVPADPLPWHYIPGWILVTTPLTYTLAALGGFLLTFRPLLQPWRTYLRAPEHRQNLLLLLWLLVPPLLVIGLNSILYNAWRHLFFIYPALLIMAARGLQYLYRLTRRATPARTWVAALLLATVGLEGAYTVVRMVKLHPHQYVYFSILPPNSAERLFELDYWGLSYREGLEWVLAHDPSAEITISGNPSYLDNNMLILPPSQRARLRYIPSRAETPTEARYFLTAYHYYGGRPKTYPDSLGREVHTIRADGLRIFSVFKRW